MKTKALILFVLLLTQIGCSPSFKTESRQDKVAAINKQQLGGRDVNIGGVVIIRYITTSYLNECIADMESRGYVVKQIQEKQGIMVNTTTVVYEKRK